LDFFLVVVLEDRVVREEVEESEGDKESEKEEVGVDPEVVEEDLDIVGKKERKNASSQKERKKS
jgi:hypothetical protein